MAKQRSMTQRTSRRGGLGGTAIRQRRPAVVPNEIIRGLSTLPQPLIRSSMPHPRPIGRHSLSPGLSEDVCQCYTPPPSPKGARGAMQGEGRAGGGGLAQGLGI